MRRINKEYIKTMKQLGLYDLLLEVRERPIKEIRAQIKRLQKTDFYKCASPKVQATIIIFYGMALDYAYRNEKTLSSVK